MKLAAEAVATVCERVREDQVVAEGRAFRPHALVVSLGVDAGTSVGESQAIKAAGSAAIARRQIVRK